MKKRTLLIAALMGGCALQSMAQQILPDNVAGDKEYRRVCREYELKSKTVWSCCRLIWINTRIHDIQTGYVL